MLGNYTIQLGNDGSAYIYGIDQPEAKVHMIQPNGTLVLKVKGGTYWTGKGMDRGYAGAEFQVYKITEVLDDGRTVKVSGQYDIPIRNEEAPERIGLVLSGLKGKLQAAK